MDKQKRLICMGVIESNGQIIRNESANRNYEGIVLDYCIRLRDLFVHFIKNIFPKK